MKRYLSSFAALFLMLLAALPAKAVLPPETLKGFVKKVGARVDEAKGNLLVTSMEVGKTRVEIRVVNDSVKSRLGFYAYGFGSARSAADVAALYEYLLRTNSDLAIGSFFVDEDKDIGYKFFLSTRDAISYPTFETAYVAMANVIAERGPKVARLAGAVRSEAPSATDPAPSTDAPPATAPADTPDQPPTDEGARGEAEEPPPPTVTNSVFEPAARPSATPKRPRRTSKPR